MSVKEKPALFYGHKSGAFCSFSNFFPAPFKLDGKIWPTSEHYFMAQKTLDPIEKERIRKAKTPYEAKRMGRQVKLIQNWDTKKYNVMLKALYAKFTQNEHICKILLSTGNRPIHENCKDPWWGGGPSFPAGRDLLGKALIEIRSQITTINEMENK